MYSLRTMVVWSAWLKPILSVLDGYIIKKQKLQGLYMVKGGIRRNFPTTLSPSGTDS